MKIHLLLIALTCTVILTGCNCMESKCPLAKAEPQKQVKADSSVPERQAILLKLKPEHVEEYKEYHANVWPELIAAYKEAGIEKCTCYVGGEYLIVIVEYGDNATKESLEAVGRNEYDVKWQGIMKTFRNTDFEAGPFEEVFRME